MGFDVLDEDSFSRYASILLESLPDYAFTRGG